MASTGGPLRYSGDSAMSPLVLSNSSSSTGAGCHGTDWPMLCLYAFTPIALLPGVLARVRRDEVSLLLVAPFWPGSMVLGPNFSPRRLSMGDSHQEGSPLTSGGLSPPPGGMKVVGVAPEGHNS